MKLKLTYVGLLVLYTLHIHMQTQNIGGLGRFRYERFINFLTSVHSNTRRETQFLLCWPYYADAQRILWCLRSLSVEIRKIQLRASTVENSTLFLSGRNSIPCLHGLISTAQLTLFKILKFSEPSLPGMTSSTLQPHFHEGLLWQMGIVISFARERKTAPNDNAPELRAE